MTKPKIHFACMFGVEYELDIMPYWTGHYTGFHFDSYHAFLHKEDGRISPDIQIEFKNLGFTIECIAGPQGNGNLRRLILGFYASTLPPEDFLVIADADEYQSMPDTNNVRDLMVGKDHVVLGPDRPTPLDYYGLLSHYDIIGGFLIDRYATRLEACYSDPFHQYPYEEPWTGKIQHNFTPAFLRRSEWLDTRRTKILAARAGYQTSYAGCHCMHLVPSEAKIMEDCKVYHFAWRESAKRKMAVKTYFTPENLREINLPEPVGAFV